MYMSNRKTIVMYEISQKQHFIFRTNRLLENIGASHIIRELTTDPRNFFNSAEFKNYSSESLPLPEPQYRIVGGGNATFIFDSEEDATTFSRNLSFNILRYLQGIELFLIKRTFDWNRELLYRHGNIPGLMEILRNEMAKKKNERRYAVRQVSWGIQQSCVTSGMPANLKIEIAETNEVEPRAEEFKLIKHIGKNVRNKGYHSRFIIKEELPPVNGEYTFITQNHLEQVFGKGANSSDVKSYLAIVALDGNSMGVKVAKFFEQPFTNNEDFIEKYKNFTDKIDDAYTQAFRKTIRYVMENYDLWASNFYGDDESVLEKWRNVIPIRPIIASGDDISFITYGKLGIEISKIFLKHLQMQTITIGAKENESTYSFEACAGVAIIRHKYPFWLGIKLAEELCSNAKKRLKNNQAKWEEVGMAKVGQPFDTSLIDWQLVSSSDMVEDIESYRKKYFQNKDGSKLIMRPYYIQQESDKKMHFASYERAFKQVAVKAIQRTEENEADQQNENIPAMVKWKNLREAYQNGVLAVNQWQILSQFYPTGKKETDNLFYRYRDGFGLIGNPQDEDGQAFATYYDAIEIFDFFIDLSGGNEA